MSLSKCIAIAVCVVILTVCGANPQRIPPTSISNTQAPGNNTVSVESASLEGNAEQGANLFKTAQGPVPACSTCHSTGQDKIVGPGLGGISSRAETRVSGQSATDYIRTSILNPDAYIVPGFENIMPPIYEQRLSDQDVANLIAYLMTLA